MVIYTKIFKVLLITLFMVNSTFFYIFSEASDSNLIFIPCISNSVRSNEYTIIINVTEDEAMMDGHQFYSDEDYLGVGDRQGIGGPWISWLKFDLSSLQNKDIISANLFLYLFQENSQLNPPIYVHYSSDDSWSEDSIKGSNYPNYNPTYTDYNDEPFEVDNWYSWNVTADVKQELNKNLILSEMLTNHGKDGDKYFVEKEYDWTKKAYLNVKIKSTYNAGIKLTNGHGNGTEIFAGYQSYNFNPKIVSLNSPNDLDNVTIHIDPVSQDLKIKWDRFNNQYSKLNDINNYLNIDKSSAVYQDNIWDLNVSIMFNLNYPEEKLSDIKIECWSGNKLLDSDVTKKIFIVRKNLIFNGNLQISGEHQGPLSNDAWVQNGETLDFSGLILVYESDNDKSPSENTCQIKLFDDLDNSEIVSIGQAGTFEHSITAEKTSTDFNNYRFSIIPASADKTSLPPFRLKIDDKGPSAPINFEFHSDSITDPTTISDNDDTIYLSWSSAVETGSGIKGYYYGEVGTNPTFTTDTTGQISGLKEGNHNFEVYAQDNVGNIGDKSSSSVIIDMTDPVFSGFSPDENQWMNKTPVLYSISITDNSGSGINKDTIEYSIMKSGSDEWGTWQKPDRIINDDTIVNAEKELNLPEGKDNFIKWRVKDISGNGPVESKSYRVMVDTKPVIFSNFSPTTFEKRNITATITLQDTSGIASFEYRIKLTGENDFGSWQNKEIHEFDAVKTISLTMELPFGNLHKIQFRASDIAGNKLSLSEEYSIKINSVPNVVITSPDSTLTYKTSDMIFFDASETIDEDNDSLKFWWESDIMGELKRTSSFNSTLKYGTHKITLKVTDDGGHIVNVSFDLEVIPVDTDGDGFDDSEDSDDDGDGMPDYWENMHGLNPLKNDAQADKDGDGYTNKEEYNAGTDPSDKDSHPKGLSSSMVSTIVILVVVMLIVIIAMGIGFILYRRQVKKKLIIPEVVSRPIEIALPDGAKAGVSLPAGEKPSDRVLSSELQPQLQLPPQTLTAKEIIDRLDQRLVMEEISEELYRELKRKYLTRMETPDGTVSRVKKKKKRLYLPPTPPENE